MPNASLPAQVLSLTLAHGKQLFACEYDHALLCLKTCCKGYKEGIREDWIAAKHILRVGTTTILALVTRPDPTSAKGRL